MISTLNITFSFNRGIRKIIVKYKTVHILLKRLQNNDIKKSCKYNQNMSPVHSAAIFDFPHQPQQPHLQPGLVWCGWDDIITTKLGQVNSDFTACSH